MAATAAIAIGAKAPSITVNQATLAGDLAVARGTRLVVDGHADAVVAGGVDELFPEVYRRLAEMGALSPMQGRAPEGCRPFAADHNGPVLGEGATFLVLEELDDRAGARGADHRRDRGGGVGQRADRAAHRATGAGRSRLARGPAGPLVRSGAGGRGATEAATAIPGSTTGSAHCSAATWASAPTAAAALAGAAVRPARRAGRLRVAAAALDAGAGCRGAGPRHRARRLPHRAAGGAAVVSDHLIVIPVFNEARHHRRRRGAGAAARPGAGGR